MTAPNSFIELSQNNEEYILTKCYLQALQKVEHSLLDQFKDMNRKFQGLDNRLTKLEVDFNLNAHTQYVELNSRLVKCEDAMVGKVQNDERSSILRGSIPMLEDK